MKSTLSKLQNLRNEDADRNDSERAKDVSPSEFPRNLSEKLQLLLKETQQEKSDLQKQLSQQQKSRSELEERLKTEQVSSQSLQLQLEANELSIRELRLEVEEGRRQKTALEETVRRLQLQIAEEMDRHATIERDLQLALSTTQAELSELRGNTRDWIILREEVTLCRKVLGNGAWGTVREGTFRGSKVAVKEIHELILSDHNRRLFEREMNIASRCRHPNLLQFIGATNNDGSPLFVTELLDSCLRRLLSELEITPKEILNLALDVAKGLNYLHLNKPLPIIHRDISSANVLLWRGDDSWRAKLSDYGAANFMQKCMTANPGAMIYSAPEAFTLKQSPKVNIFCLAFP
ncbi:probable serine/threonine-protein kinase DDB_G0271682 [Stylophora pistillata]|uniref:probable serine/threonine-protein kinase DDB_G0271682 n=1 Tax=Stylophora pistillata TaxID=50429 RepID=UPI000C03EE65|nr:probable serine/threonine-protein kinase DDB_G0271682 [Stylophora pistillata]